MRVMEPALDVLHRSLQGDPGARSFLDRTCSIYVLDATDVANPKTYACWNFIQQAMNEIERVEAAAAAAASGGGSPHSQHQQVMLPQQLQGHVQLLANMALRVARRSNAIDKELVATCISNAAKYTASHNECQRLIDLNLELRDIVMGRIAAMAFDDSFHRQTSASSSTPHYHHHHSYQNQPSSQATAFSDYLAMETFCAVLAANAVSNGPTAVNHLVMEWMVPSSRTLPPFALACVTLHLADEALRKSAPSGTQDMLQRLSNSVMATVLAPVLCEAIKEENSPNNSNTGAGGGATCNPNDAGGGFLSPHERNNRIAAVCLRAMDRWCTVTDLSLAQIKHICSKVQINIVDVIGDAMYSDSPVVIEALAELIEAVVQRHQVPTVSEERMTQVRYIMQVDEASFRSNIAPAQLVTIEAKEMESILEELCSAIGLQRFRFVERQANGDTGVCRNLTRIAASVCQAVAKASSDGQSLKSGPGLLDLLLKAASHPSVYICAIALEVLSSLIPLDVGLSHRLLPTLQRRAIAPHQFIETLGGQQAPSLFASDSCGVNTYEFQIFRDTVLKDALVACWKDNGNNFMSSCTSAIEEFCSPNASMAVSFHLEAALFCMAAVAEEALSAAAVAAAAAGVPVGGGPTFAHSAQLERCISALANKPTSLTGNPLTLSQLCQFVRKYDRWFVEGPVEGALLAVATELALSTFSLAASNFPMETGSVEMRREASISPYKEAALALKLILSQAPQHFLTNQAIAALGAGWEASYAASNHPGIITVEDRQALCNGICHVLASLPDNQRAKSLQALAMPTLDCLETMLNLANQTPTNSEEQRDVILDRIADEVTVLTTMARSFTDAFTAKDASMERDCDTSDGHVAIVDSAFEICRKAWPSITHVASKYSYHESLANAIGNFLIESLPPQCQDNNEASLVKQITGTAASMVQSATNGQSAPHLQPVLEFLRVYVKVHGDLVEKHARSSIATENNQSSDGTEWSLVVGESLETLLLGTLNAIKNSLGTTWTSPQRQGQGQPAFETKAEPMSDRQSATNNEFLSTVFSFLRTCAERCPFFLLHLEEDTLYRRSVESAVSSLVEADVDTSKSAMQYLESTVKLTHSVSDDVRRGAEDVLSSLYPTIILMLVAGSCGKLNSSTLGEAAILLSQVLVVTSSTNAPPSIRGETEGNVVQALKDGHFLLGRKAQNVSLDVLMRCSRNEIVAADLATFLEDLWELHQIQCSEALEGSESVDRFCRKYGS